MQQKDITEITQHASEYAKALALENAELIKVNKTDECYCITREIDKFMKTTLKLSQSEELKKYKAKVTIINNCLIAIFTLLLIYGIVLLLKYSFS